MNPIMIAKNEERISVCCFNPGTLIYEEMLSFKDIGDFREYVYKFIQVATQDMILLSGNMRALAMALEEMTKPGGVLIDYVKSMGDIKLGTDSNIGED